jgi:hypothetical protein
MKKFFYIGALLIINITFIVNGRNANYIKLSDIQSLVFTASGGGPKIYSKDYCECHTGGVKNPDFSSFCGMSWKCVSGSELCSSPGCSAGCSCVD